MRKIRVTGGFSDYASGVLTEKTGRPLTSASFKIALIADGEDPPPYDDPVWVNPVSATPITGKTNMVRVTHLVTDTYPPGSYWLWVVATDTPTKVPVKGNDDMFVLT